MSVVVQQVPPQHLHSVWPWVEGFLDAALHHGGGEYDVSQLKTMVVCGCQTLLVAVDDDNVIQGACTVAFENYPNQRVAFMTTAGGKAVLSKDTLAQFQHWCKGQGATVFRCACRESMARLLRRVGMRERYTIMETAL